MPLRLVHVSDIHFQGYGTDWDYDEDQRRELLRDTRALVASDGKIDGILIGGDIAYRAAKSEYQAARRWIDELREACGGLDTGRVWTVPGNHDVDRSAVGKSPVMTQFRSDVRNCSSGGLDAMLRDRLVQDPAAAGLVASLAEYNAFAGDYQCAVTCTQPNWYDASLQCDGLQVRLLGLNSVLISDKSDSDDHETGKLVLGTWQCMVPRLDDTIHVVLTHHPPSWVRDWSIVEPYLRRAHVLLFGHEHVYAARQPVPRGTVEVYGGAVGPERTEGMPTDEYAPTYNVLTMARFDGDTVVVTVQPRYWHHDRTTFVPHPDGTSRFEVALEQPPDGGTTASVQSEPPEPSKGPPPRPANPLAGGSANASTPEATPLPQPATELRRIGSEFMGRSWTDRVELARRLGVLDDHDLQLPDTELFPTLLRRIRDAGLTARLIEELDRD